MAHDTAGDISHRTNSHEQWPQSPSLADEMQHDVDPSPTANELPKVRKTHHKDATLPREKIETVTNALEDGDADQTAREDEPSIGNSPYEEVRAAVRPKDDPTIMANIIRAWVLGMIMVTIGSGLNMFLSMR
jgi:hypothetical protein